MPRDAGGAPVRVLVALVTCNSADVLSGLLDALPAAMEGVPSWDVVAVDNASTDVTWRTLREAGAVGTRVQTGHNAGYAAGINRAVRAGPAADAVLVLNPDVRPRPGMVARLLAELEATGAGIVVPRLQTPAGDIAFSLRRDPTVLRALGEAVLGGLRGGGVPALGELVATPADYEHDRWADWASGAAMLLSRACLDAVGEWEEGFFLYSEETDYALRARDAGFGLRYVAEAVAVHLGGDAPTDAALWSLLQVNRARLVTRRRGRVYGVVFRAVLLLNAGVRTLLGRRVHRRAFVGLLRPASHAVVAAGGPAPRGRAATGEPVTGPAGAQRRWRRRTRGRARRVLIIVQNLPVPLDRRVWLQARALVDAGIGVSVICPRGPGQPLVETLERVRLYRYPPPPRTVGRLSYFVEFAYCWLATALWSVVVRVRDGFGVIQACNPPDTYFALALAYKPFGVRFVFDQHDLCPEVFESRFGGVGSLLHRGLLTLERSTYRSADRVIATNESYRRVAIERGAVDPARVTVVRNGPALEVFTPQAPQPALRRGREHLCCYVGVMGPQDGVDGLLRAVAVLVHEMGRRDVLVALLGFGDMEASLRRLATELDLDEWVEFTGRADTATIAAYLSTASVGLCPDPKTPFNDASTMNKTMEYMALGLPVVAYDLTETRVSAGEAALYVEEDDHRAFAKAVDRLLDDPERRVEMGAAGRRRVEAQLAWSHQVGGYLGVHRELTASVTEPEAGSRRSGRRARPDGRPNA